MGISHEGATTATIAAMAASRAVGARTALITGSAASPAAATADVVVATVEMDRSWCHTVGYVSPIVVAAVAASFLADGSAATAGLGRRMADGIEAAHASGAGGSRPDEADRGDDRQRDPRAHRRHRRRSHRGARDRPQARGGVLGARGGPRPRDVPARPLARDRPRDRAVAGADRTIRPRGARQAGAPGLGGGRGPGHAAGGDPGRRRRGGDPRLADAGRSDRRARVAGPARGRGVPARDRRAAPARHARGRGRPRHEPRPDPA